jgi:hypothetical protein
MAVFGAPAAHASVIQMTPNNIGLVGYWSFNEGTSTIAHDYSGNGNNGTLSGSTLPTWVPGKFGDALQFSGSSQYVSFSDSSLPSGADPSTESAWVYPTQVTANKIIMWYGTGSGSAARGMEILANADFRFFGYSNDCDSNLTLSLNKWSLVVATYDGTSQRTYVNGVPGSTCTLTWNTALGHGVIGRDVPWGGDSRDWVGSIDEVRIYNRALSATEVEGLYQSGAAKLNSSQSPGTLANGLVGWWTMDGADTVWSSATAGTEADKSGNGNTGTLTNMSRATSPVIGKIGQALQFNGSTSYVTISGTSLNGSTLSASAWIRASTCGNLRTGIITRRGGAGNWNFNVAGSDGGNTCKLEFANSGTILGYGNTTLSLNMWYHVAVVANGTSITFYVNGAPDGTITGTWTNDNNVAINIGAMTAGTLYFFNGIIDDVRVYNRALSASEVQQLYGLGAGTHVNTSSANLQNGSTLQSGLVGYWTFDGPTISGTTVKDLSGQGNNGTNNGATPTIGKIG